MEADKIYKNKTILYDFDLVVSTLNHISANCHQGNLMDN